MTFGKDQAGREIQLNLESHCNSKSTLLVKCFQVNVCLCAKLCLRYWIFYRRNKTGVNVRATPMKLLEGSSFPQYRRSPRNLNSGTGSYVVKTELVYHTKALVSTF